MSSPIATSAHLHQRSTVLSHAALERRLMSSHSEGGLALHASAALPGWASPTPLDSLTRHTTSTAPPELSHTLTQARASVLSLAADKRYLYSGSQTGDIHVWNRASLQLEKTIRGHSGSVLALELAPEKGWLFSSSGDSTIRIHSTSTLETLCVVLPVDDNTGDLFSLFWDREGETLYCGSQSTSIQWITLSHPLPTHGPTTSPPRRGFRTKARFFAAGAPASRAPSPSPSPSPAAAPAPAAALGRLEVRPGDVVHHAHYGYVYSLAMARLGGRRLLVSGSGDEDIKLWAINDEDHSLKLVRTLQGCLGGVLSLAVHESTLFAGVQSGHIKIWDLETFTLIRTIIAHDDDVLALALLDGNVYATSAGGIIQRWNASFELTASWKGHDGIILSAIVAPPAAEEKEKGKKGEAFQLVTGGNDQLIKLWALEKPKKRWEDGDHAGSFGAGENGDAEGEGEEKERRGESSVDVMLYALSKFVAIPSVSGVPARREDCRQGAIYLKQILAQMGATGSTLLPGAPERNPLVLATFKGKELPGGRPKRRILFYGHYDCIDAHPEEWTHDPWTMVGRDGYLYGRAVSDNKGPILAAASAASSLLEQRQLDVDLVLLIEGEEETGSAGFREAVKAHKDLIGPIDAIMLSNSYWLGESRPCLTFGLRGVIHTTVEVWNDGPDLHSGIAGGAVGEPMLDMVRLLGVLSDGEKVLVPGFYDAVREMTPEEEATYDELAKATGRDPKALASRWRRPALSVGRIDVSGEGNLTTIPSRVKSNVSIRIVPDQDLETIAQSLVSHIEGAFERMKTGNRLKVSVTSKSDYWLGDRENEYFRALQDAVQDEWGVAPLHIREGGSIPSLPFLQKEFGGADEVRTVHLPMGQSSDQAHLANERIRLLNLTKGKAVVENFLRRIAAA